MGNMKANFTLQQRPYRIVKTQRGHQIILDHYVINKQNSQFIYAALNDTHAFCLKRDYLQEKIFNKYPDFYTNVSMSSYSYYKKWIWKPIRDQRK